jgi:hypothetical protein
MPLFSDDFKGASDVFALILGSICEKASGNVTMAAIP